MVVALCHTVLKFGCMVSKLCKGRERDTNRHTHQNTLQPYCGKVISAVLSSETSLMIVSTCNKYCTKEKSIYNNGNAFHFQVKTVN